MNKRIKKLFAFVCAAVTCFALAACNKDETPRYGNLNVNDMSFNYAELKLTSAAEVSLYKGETYTLGYTVQKGAVSVTGETVKGTGVGVYNRQAQVFVATGIGDYRLKLKSAISDESATVDIHVVEQASGGGVVEPDSSFRFEKAEDAAGYAYGEMMFANGEKDFWESKQLPQRYGMEGAVGVSYYIASDGIYFYLRVNDATLYKGKGSGEKKIEDSDRVELHLDTLYNGGDAPQTDDYRVRVACDGTYDIAVGTGSDWKVNPNFKLDALKVARIGGDEMGTITERGTSGTASSRDTDTGYEIKLFMSYNNFSFAKKDAYGLTLAHADYVDGTTDQRFNAAGDVKIPRHFRPMSEHGIGTAVALSEKIDGYKSAFYNDAQTYTVNTMDYGHVASNGKVECTTYVKAAAEGLYILMQTSQNKLTYQYVTGGHTWKSDHVEIRIDANHDGASQSAENGDRYLHVDVSGTTIAAYGITDDTRTIGEYNYIVAMRTVGQAQNFSGENVTLSTACAPDSGVGHDDGKMHIYYEIFLPYAEINATRGGSIGLMVAYGNPCANATGIGYVFNTAGVMTQAEADVFSKYNKYLSVNIPA